MSRSDEPISFAGNAELIDSYLSFELCRKSLITKLVSSLETAAVDEIHYLRTAALIGELEQYVQELSMDLPCDVYCSKMNFSTILRAVGLGIPDDYPNDLERLLDYMELCRELEKDRLYIYVNLRSYYDDEEMQAFFDSVLSHEYHILLVDSTSRSLLHSEHRVTVDNDLCEF